MTAVTADLRLIEAGFPCHQVGAETQRERDTGKAPPTHRLHVWWARRPLTPSRAAIFASLLPADADPDLFLRGLGIEKVQALVGGEAWTLTEEKEFKRIVTEDGQEFFLVDRFAEKWLEQEQESRDQNRHLIAQFIAKDANLASHPVIETWKQESNALPEPLPVRGARLPVRRVAADPAWFSALMEIGTRLGIRVPNLYGYDRAYTHHPFPTNHPQTILDPTAGGGSIPFEALRLGHKIIANDLNPVAAVILHATLNYPARFGPELAKEIQHWGNELLERLHTEIKDYFPQGQTLPPDELRVLKEHLARSGEPTKPWDHEETMTYLFARQVSCPHCGGEVPLLNSCWLSKEDPQWGVKVVTDGKARKGKVQFETYRSVDGLGPHGEDPDAAYVGGGSGQCVHCKQAIDEGEIKKQARGESEHGRWQDRLYCVVAVRYQPKLDAQGRVKRDRDNEIQTEKVTFFRPPNATDLDALRRAGERLKAKWDSWETNDIIPTEKIAPGYETTIRWPLDRYGLERWADMFTPRQFLGHGTLVEQLRALTPQILKKLGPDRGKAVVTYLQFAIDKGLDYNSKQTRFHLSRGVLINTFARHDFSLKWTFGEMVFSGPQSGAAWCVSQIKDAYASIAELVLPLHRRLDGVAPPLTILNGSASHMPAVSDRSVDLICMDPPYYNNVTYSELSDYFYIWERRGLHDLYPDLHERRLTNKEDEAIANPYRDGSKEQSRARYEQLMAEIFAECRRVVKDDGRLLVMFTHKSQEAWEALTQAIIQSGWTITSSFPVESESEEGIHTKERASAISSVFITCRKRSAEANGQATWVGFGGTGVQQRIRTEVQQALKEFERLRLNPVDEMVAAYGRALRVLSEQWPVLGEDDQPVSPIRAMSEASRVVAQYQIARLTGGRLKVDDLNPEAAMALTLYGIYGLAELPYDDARNIANSLGIPLQSRSGGYNLDGERMVGMNSDAASGRRRRTTSEEAEESGYHAPLVLKGSKLRLALPDERNPKRLEQPQTEWDILHGLLTEYQRGDVPVARAYLNRHAEGRQGPILDLLHVWAEEMPDEKLRKEAQTLLFGLQ